MNVENEKNPLACDPVTGLCEIPGTSSGDTTQQDLTAVAKPVKIIYFTDPICSSCWGIEPQLHRLKLEYGHVVEVEYRMGGLLPGWDNFNGGGIQNPADVAVHWEEASRHYQMPIDGDVWIEDPLSSSYPPSIAFVAAQLQDKEKASRLMRRLREMVFMEKRNISKWEVISEAAKNVGLDVQQLRTDYDGKAQQLFKEEMASGRKMGVRGFPTLIMSNAQNEQSVVYGSRPYEQMEQVILQLYPNAQKKTYDNSAESLLKFFGTLTTREFAELSGQSMVAAEKVLSKLAADQKILKQESKNGPLWKRK